MRFKFILAHSNVWVIIMQGPQYSPETHIPVFTPGTGYEQVG